VAGFLSRLKPKSVIALAPTLRLYGYEPRALAAVLLLKHVHEADPAIVAMTRQRALHLGPTLLNAVTRRKVGAGSINP
jgi:hypothetical protein